MMFFIKRRSISWLLAMWIIILGVVSLLTIPRDIQPQIDIPISTVATVLPGATPSDTESLLTEPLENKIEGLQNLKKMTSNSGVGFSLIVVEFDANANLDKSHQDLKDLVELAKVDLPDDATEPILTKIESDSVAAISFSLTGNRENSGLTEIAKLVQDELEKIPGTSKVNLIGGQNKIVEIKLNPTKTSGYGLNIQTVADIIKYSSPNVPIGIISSDELNYSIRIDNKYKSIEEIQNIPLFVAPDENSTIILLSDIANVSESLPEAETFSKLSVNGTESKETITLQVFKKKEVNVLNVVDSSKDKIEELKKNVLPKDIDIAISNDNSVFIRTDLGILTRSGIQTTLLIILILFLALGFVEGFMAGLSIPLSLLFAIILMDLGGMTINSLTLFSLVIALGLMVDNAIVIMEGIHDNMKRGMSSEKAAAESVNTYKWPLIAGTLTTIFAFFPMLLVSGIVGEFLKSLPLTISSALFGSLLISLTIGPSITARLLKNRKVDGRKTLLEPFFNWMGNMFHKLIYYIVLSRWAKVMTLLIALILFMGSMALPLTGTLKAEMFPRTDMFFFIINIETPNGTIIEKTRDVVEEVEKKLYEMPEVENFLTIIGTGDPQAAVDLVDLSGGNESNLANITVNLVPKEERENASYEISDELRKTFKDFPKGKITITELSEGPPGDFPITVRIQGEDLEELEEIANHIKTIIAAIPGTIDVETSMKPGLDEFKFTLDRNKVAYHGLSLPQVANLIRSGIQGIQSSTVTINEEELDILVKYDLPKINNKTNLTINDLENIEIFSPKGYAVNLGQLGNYEFTKSLSSIAREDNKRIVKIVSELQKDINPLDVTEQIQEQLIDYEIPLGYEISYGGDQQEVEQSFQDLFKSMIVGIILIGFTLVLMFNSFWQPFIILLTLPLAIIGVFPGLYLIGLELSFPAFLGIVALAGVVVNDAIVLIDRINQNRKNGIEFKESIAEAAKSRLQPIVITSITTIVGILPLALTNEFWQGLGFSLIFGLAMGTVLTLIVIPVLYYIFERRGSKQQTT
ncbi:MAG: efflux RND transporter permease subunit [bacterium]|nr:efflux RND transporter permease subunit [bacterium]